MTCSFLDDILVHLFRIPNNERSTYTAFVRMILVAAQRRISGLRRIVVLYIVRSGPPRCVCSPRSIDTRAWPSLCIVVGWKSANRGVVCIEHFQGLQNTADTLIQMINHSCKNLLSPLPVLLFVVGKLVPR